MGEGRNPVKKILCEAVNPLLLSRLREKYLFIWIPACPQGSLS
jgi:hypothetical protein